LAVVTVLCPTAAQAQVSSEVCGPVWGTSHFGPLDYRLNKARAAREVEPVHFTPKVENLISGATGSIGADINYTLRAFPNHHRALVATTRLAERQKTDQPDGMLWPVECYFERAIRFAPDDVVVRSLYAQWLGKRGRRPEAQWQLETALKTAQDSPISNYNIGLVYFELGDYDKALVQAHRALEMGWPRQELAQQLKSAGKWREPTEGAAPAAAGAAEPSPAPSAPR
jgi:tetratricopeptide (TPR) repeat protein